MVNSIRNSMIEEKFEINLPSVRIDNSVQNAYIHLLIIKEIIYLIFTNNFVQIVLFNILFYLIFFRCNKVSILLIIFDQYAYEIIYVQVVESFDEYEHKHCFSKKIYLFQSFNGAIDKKIHSFNLSCSKGLKRKPSSSASCQL